MMRGKPLYCVCTAKDSHTESPEYPNTYFEVLGNPECGREGPLLQPGVLIGMLHFVPFILLLEVFNVEHLFNIFRSLFVLFFFSIPAFLTFEAVILLVLFIFI